MHSICLPAHPHASKRQHGKQGFQNPPLWSRRWTRFFGGTRSVSNGGNPALAHLTTQKELAAIRREIAAATEMSAIFIRYFLTVTPPPPAPERDAARALGRKRLEVMLEQVAKRLSSDERFVDEVEASFQPIDQSAGDDDGTT